jgi:hypothetical protein
MSEMRPDVTAGPIDRKRSPLNGDGGPESARGALCGVRTDRRIATRARSPSRVAPQTVTRLARGVADLRLESSARKQPRTQPAEARLRE